VTTRDETHNAAAEHLAMRAHGHPRTRRTERPGTEVGRRHTGVAAATGVDRPDYVDCAVIIVTYNSARDIAALLDSVLAAATGLTLRVIVVDNDSADDTVERVGDHPWVICVQTGANLGYAGGINVGRHYAGPCNALGILNPDLVLEPGSLREMFTALDDPAVGMVVPMLLDLEGHREASLRREPTLVSEIADALFGNHFKRRPGWMSDVVRDQREYGYRHAVDWASGAAMLISGACDRAVGAWDERFFLYMEEVDYAARVRAAGLRVEYVPQARARHRGAGSGQSRTLLALMAVSRIRYFEKYGRPRVLRALVLLNQLLRVTNPRHRAALLAASRRSAWKPLIAGLKTHSAECGADATISPPSKPERNTCQHPEG
jgi:GT2 family glycosyltransferase